MNDNDILDIIKFIVKCVLIVFCIIGLTEGTKYCLWALVLILIFL